MLNNITQKLSKSKGYGDEIFGLGDAYDVFEDENKNFRQCWTCHHSAVSERLRGRLRGHRGK